MSRPWTLINLLELLNYEDTMILYDYDNWSKPIVIKKAEAMKKGKEFLRKPIKFLYFNGVYRAVEVHFMKHDEEWFRVKDEKLVHYYADYEFMRRTENELDGGVTEDD